MNRKLYLLILLFSIVTFQQCSSFKNNYVLWEGISGDKLKVTISDFFPLNENENTYNVQFEIKEKLNQRASLILASHISINLRKNRISSHSDIIFNKLITETITNGKLINYECNENNYCTANGEYIITEIEKYIQTLND